jgi:hypothetical protein
MTRCYYLLYLAWKKKLGGKKKQYYIVRDYMNLPHSICAKLSPFHPLFLTPLLPSHEMDLPPITSDSEPDFLVDP